MLPGRVEDEEVLGLGDRSEEVFEGEEDEHQEEQPLVEGA